MHLWLWRGSSIGTSSGRSTAQSCWKCQNVNLLSVPQTARSCRVWIKLRQRCSHICHWINTGSWTVFAAHLWCGEQMSFWAKAIIIFVFIGGQVNSSEPREAKVKIQKGSLPFKLFDNHCINILFLCCLIATHRLLKYLLISLSYMLCMWKVCFWKLILAKNLYD